MKPVDYIALAIPVFFALIGVELLVARWRGERLYRLNDSINDLATGVLQQLMGVFTKAALVGVYAWIWEHHRLFEMSVSSPWVWIGCFSRRRLPLLLVPSGQPRVEFALGGAHRPPLE